MTRTTHPRVALLLALTLTTWSAAGCGAGRAAFLGGAAAESAATAAALGEDDIAMAPRESLFAFIRIERMKLAAGMKRVDQLLRLPPFVGIVVLADVGVVRGPEEIQGGHVICVAVVLDDAAVKAGPAV